MSHHVYRNRQQPPNTPQRARIYAVKRPYPQQQMEQEYDLVEEPPPHFRIPPSSSVKDAISLIGVVIILIIALDGFQTGNTLILGMAALLLASLIGGPKLVELLLRFWKRRIP